MHLSAVPDCARKKPFDFLFFILLAALLVVAWSTFRDYGIPFDEDVQDRYGQYILSWYLTLGADRSAVTYLDLFYYGGLFDTVAALVNLVSPLGHFETRHLLNALVAILGIAGTWRLARHLAGPAVGFLAAALLASMPSWYGMSFINPKDIPFATAMVWSLYFLTRIAEAPERTGTRTVIGFGLAAGAALGVRVGGVLALGYLALICLLPVAQLLPRDRRGALRLALRLGRRIVLPATIVAWLVMLAFWPYAQINPLWNPIEAQLHFSTLAPDIDTLFFGREVDSQYRPLGYLPVYLVLKMPLPVLVLAAVAAIAGGAYAVRRGIAGRYVPLLLAIFFPIVFVLLTRPELYDAERHFLFLLPPFAVAAALGFDTLRRLAPMPSLRAGLAASLALATAPQLSAMNKLHPYEYAYYNPLIGGVVGAQDLFETEYWGSSLTEATRRLTEFDEGSPTDPARVAYCGNEASLAAALPPGFVLSEENDQADYYISTTRHHCEREMAGTEIGRVERDGVPFAVIKRLDTMHARHGVPRTRS